MSFARNIWCKTSRIGIHFLPIESDRGASFEIKLEDPEADLTQVYVSSQNCNSHLLEKKPLDFPGYY